MRALVLSGLFGLVACSSGGAASGGPPRDDASAPGATASAGAPTSPPSSAREAERPGSSAASAEVAITRAPVSPACVDYDRLEPFDAIHGACHGRAATTKAMLPKGPGIAPATTGFAVPGCSEIPVPSCDAALSALRVDQAAPHGPLLIFEYEGPRFTAYQFVGFDGETRYVAAGERSGRCAPARFAANAGRFVFQEVEVDPAADAGEAGTRRLGRAAGVVDALTLPRVEPGTPPKFFDDKLEWFEDQSLKSATGAASLRFESRFSQLALVDDMAFALIEDGPRIDVAKLGGAAAPLVVAPAGAAITELSARSTGLAWVVKKGDACELFVSRLAITQKGVAPNGYGLVPCKNLQLFAEHALVGDVLVRLADKKRVHPLAACKDAARCSEAAVLSATPSHLAVYLREPEAIQLVPIGPLFDAVDASAKETPR